MFSGQRAACRSAAVQCQGLYLTAVPFLSIVLTESGCNLPSPGNGIPDLIYVAPLGYLEWL